MKKTNNRYSVLDKLPIDEQKEICIRLCAFFSPQNNDAFRHKLGLPVVPGRNVPLSFADFLKHSDVVGASLWPKRKRIGDLIIKLSQKGIITSCGGNSIAECFWFMHELSNIQRQGFLWLGEALGPQYIGSEIEKDIAYITGITPLGDISVGTGVLISSNIILTCAHVVCDMKIDEIIKLGGKEVSVASVKSHEKIDVGLIFLKDHVERNLKDLAFRKAIMLEEVVIAGFPTVPRSLNPTYTLQRGEISGFVAETTDRTSFDLFSAIARPGNSGGPVVGMDGRILGIVTRSFERDKEVADTIETMPFFASVPSSIIEKCVSELINGEIEIPWEDYQ